MIRNLLATTAIATIVATGAFAQTTAPVPMQEPAAAQQVPLVKQAEGFLANELIGQSVYNGTGDDAENIGSISDLVISPDGDIRAVVIGVGGFLGMGKKNVAIEYDLLSWSERDGQEWIVVETTADALKAQEEFDYAAYTPQPADADVRETKPATADDLANAPVKAADDETAMVPAEEPTDDAVAVAPTTVDPADGEAAQAPETDATETAAINRDTLTEMAVGDIRAEEFVGTTVYGANDENVGEIGDVVLSQDGTVDAVIINVGGFLGIGEKEVAVGMDNLAFMSDENGKLYLYTPLTKEQLEAQAAYEEGTYTERRDEMRMNVPVIE